MSENEEIDFPGNPKPYPKTSPTEISSRDIFYGLLNRRFVKGDINVMDKYPNWDGVLEMTDEQNYPVGKIEIQLKTLLPHYRDNPKFQCEKSFFAYCQTAALPVILVAVDQLSRKAYWREIDGTTLREVKENINGESYLLSIPLQNYLDGEDERYITAWTISAKVASHKVWNYEEQVVRREELEKSLASLIPKLDNPVNLPSFALKEIHDFLDEYNYILDREFGAIKAVLYPNYWKIGMGIIKYEFNNIEFILFPVEYGKSHLLIKEIKPGYDWRKEMLEGNVLMWTSLKNSKDITHFSYSYGLLEDYILRVAGKYNFPLANAFLANEYLISYIDRYQLYLNVEQGQDSYSLSHIKYMLHTVIPMMVATDRGFAKWVKEYNYDLESYNKSNSRAYVQKQIAEAEKNMKEHFTPPVRVKVVSELYNIELLDFFIGFLESQGFTSTKRQYLPGHRDGTMYGVPPFKTWNRQVLWRKAQSFFENFYHLYTDYINNHFTRLTEYLKIVESKEMTLVHILCFENDSESPPYLEVYHLRPSRPEMGRILFYRDQDETCPINRKEFLKDSKWNCQVDGMFYEIVLMHVQVLDFMFSHSPMYTLIKEKLVGKLTKLLAKRKRTPDDDKLSVI